MQLRGELNKAVGITFDNTKVAKAIAKAKKGGYRCAWPYIYIGITVVLMTAIGLLLWLNST